jgi:hypothetical protein
MYIIELVLALGIGAIVAILIRIERRIASLVESYTTARYDDRLERTVADAMPTLWCEVERRDALKIWYERSRRLATPEHEWHWYAVAERLKSYKPTSSDVAVSPAERERLEAATTDLLRRKDHDLSDLEVSYLVFRAWRDVAGAPSSFVPDHHIERLETRLRDIAISYLSPKQQAPVA